MYKQILLKKKTKAKKIHLCRFVPEKANNLIAVYVKCKISLNRVWKKTGMWATFSKTKVLKWLKTERGWQQRAMQAGISVAPPCERILLLLPSKLGNSLASSSPRLATCSHPCNSLWLEVTINTTLADAHFQRPASRIDVLHGSMITVELTMMMKRAIVKMMRMTTIKEGASLKWCFTWAATFWDDALKLLPLFYMMQLCVTL